MPRSERIRLRDVRAMLEVVRETYSSSTDPLVRVQNAVTGLCRLTGAQSGLFGLLEKANGELPRFILAQPGGEMDHINYSRYQRYAGGEYIIDALYQNVHREVDQWKTIRREARIDRRTWHSTPWFNEVLRPMRLDDCMYAFGTLRGRYCVGVGLSRPSGARPFGRRQAVLFSLVHRELEPLYASLAAGLLTSPARLTPTLKKTLALLMQGLSEKQIAHRRDLSRHTVHDHVKQIYRHYGVSSRAELLSRRTTRTQVRPSATPR